ncbi:MAG: rRNA adenine N(6)-methyltransferase family protein [bacterium]|nr:rRNA adenine N(6)-methyltransferase family protein [bacterium]
MARNHRISQNFLRSPKIALMLVGHTNIRKRDFTLDIGAGSGVITYALSKKSAQVLAIEFDRSTFQKLKQNTRDLKNVEILNADFLHFNLNKLPKDYKVCANIPFHLSSEIIQKLVFSGNPPKSAYLILQKQFAKKLISSNQHFTSALGAKIFPFFEAKIKKPLRKTDFTPPPAVETVFFEMKRREVPLIARQEIGDFCDFIDRMFANKNFYLNNCGRKFRTRTPSQLVGEEWLEIWKNQQKNGKI